MRHYRVFTFPFPRHPDVERKPSLGTLKEQNHFFAYADVADDAGADSCASARLVGRRG